MHSLQSIQSFSSAIIDNVERVIVGKRPVIELMLAALHLTVCTNVHIISEEAGR